MSLEEQVTKFTILLSDPAVNVELVKEHCDKQGIDFDQEKYFPGGKVDLTVVEELATKMAKKKLGIEDEEQEEVVEEPDVFDSEEPEPVEYAEETEVETEEEDSAVEPPVFEYPEVATLTKKDLSVGDQGFFYIEDIQFRHNVRGQIIEDESFSDLIESIKEKGVTQPVSVDKNGVLLAGYRRVEASKRAGLLIIPVYCQNGEQAFDIQVSENLDRQDLCALDYCLAILDAKEKEEWDKDKISKKFKVHTTVLSRITKHIKNIPEDLYPVLRSDEKSDIALMALIELAELEEEDLIRSLLDREGSLKLKDIRALATSLKDETEEDFDDEDDLDPEDVEDKKTTKESIQSSYWDSLAEFTSITREFREYAEGANAKIDKNAISELIKELEQLL